MPKLTPYFLHVCNNIYQGWNKQPHIILQNCNSADNIVSKSVALYMGTLVSFPPMNNVFPFIKRHKLQQTH